MTAVTYTARRSLTTGHVASTGYTIRIRAKSIDPDQDIQKKASTALSGRQETVVWRNLKRWQVTTGAVRHGELEVLEEFLESVIEGETFEFDEFGMPGSPAAPVTAYLDGKYRKQRFVQQGDGGADDYYRYSFTVRASGT